MRVIYLLVDTGSKPNYVLTMTTDETKATHWAELLQEQGKSIAIVNVSEEMQDVMDSMKGTN